MSHVIYLLCPREKESESEPDWSPRTQSTSTYVAIVRVWSISSLVRAIFIEKHLTLRGACLMNARRCRSSSRWGYNSAHKCGRCTRICKVRLQCAFCTRTWQAFYELWRWFPNCYHAFPSRVMLIFTAGQQSWGFLVLLEAFLHDCLCLYVARPIKSCFCVPCDTINIGLCDSLMALILKFTLL